MDDKDSDSWRKNMRDPEIVWPSLSIVAVLICFIWINVSPDSNLAFGFYFFSWMSFLLSVGYVSTPAGSWTGKTAFGAVVLMILGIAFKVLHLPAANILIIAGLVILAVSCVIHWFRHR